MLLLGFPVNSIQTQAAGPQSVRRTERKLARSTEMERALVRLERLSHLSDEAIRVPGTSIRLGWDALLGLIPVVGDASTSLIAGYYLWQAHRLGARRRTLLRMLANVGIDFTVGSIPLVGDLFDVAWRANRKNMQVLIRELQWLGKLPDEIADERVAQLVAKHAKPKRTTSRWRKLIPRPMMVP